MSREQEATERDEGLPPVQIQASEMLDCRRVQTVSSFCAKKLLDLESLHRPLLVGTGFHFTQKQTMPRRLIKAGESQATLDPAGGTAQRRVNYGLSTCSFCGC